MSSKQKKSQKTKIIITIIVIILVAVGVVAGSYFAYDSYTKSQEKQQQEKTVASRGELPDFTEEDERVLSALKSMTVEFIAYRSQDSQIEVKQTSGETKTYRVGENLLVTKNVSADESSLKEIKPGQMIQIGYDTDYKEVRTVWYVEEK